MLFPIYVVFILKIATHLHVAFCGISHIFDVTHMLLMCVRASVLYRV
jgi:hypothetical protein